MRIDQIELTELLLAKFAHDLAGVVGGISNGTEFLLEATNEDIKTRAFTLLKTSSDRAVSILRFYRTAYGISKHDGEADLDELNVISAELLHSRNISLVFNRDIKHAPEYFLCAKVGKAILCLIESSSVNLAQGGLIKMSIVKNHECSKVIIETTGLGLKFNENNHKILLGEKDSTPLSIRNVHYYYTRSLIERLKAKLTINISSGAIEYVVDLIV